ncbi:MAG TPA: EAL domain-containing protein [Novosphingobium sp.]
MTASTIPTQENPDIAAGDLPDASAPYRAERNLFAQAIGMAAVILFVGTGSQVMPQVIRSLQGIGLPPDQLLSNALLLNIALIIFGLGRYRDLAAEVQEHRLAEERARALADRDPLTGCLNRRALAAATNALLQHCAAQGEHVGFLMIDVDNFKRINDNNGHVVGDAVLRACAQRIAERLPGRALLARLGGDEFACVVPFSEARAESIEALAIRIATEISQPVAVDRTEIDVTVSVGIARSDREAPDGTEADAEQLQHMADVAMYHAKRLGRNRSCWFEPQMERAMRRRHELEQALRAGVVHGEFVPHYQPQIDLATRRIIGLEMLARWNSPDHADIGPEVFIPIAEDIGLIGLLSEGLIRQALDDAREWDPQLILSVNISPLQLRDPWFAQKLLRLLVAANFPPHRLEIEITESCLHQHLDEVRTVLASLKNQGVGISLDDFGSGYATLAQLQSLPFDRIKIDRSFVAPMPGSEHNENIVRAITSLGEGLGLPITAEGVETEEIAARLEGLGDLQAQGFLYARPASAEATRSLLAGLGLLAEGHAPAGAGADLAAPLTAPPVPPRTRTA